MDAILTCVKSRYSLPWRPARSECPRSPMPPSLPTNFRGSVASDEPRISLICYPLSFSTSHSTRLLRDLFFTMLPRSSPRYLPLRNSEWGHEGSNSTVRACRVRGRWGLWAWLDGTLPTYSWSYLDGKLRCARRFLILIGDGLILPLHRV